METFFSIIQIILGAMGLWNQFLDFLDQKFTADLEARRQARLDALNKLDQAKTDGDIFDAEEGVVDNKP